MSKAVRTYTALMACDPMAIQAFIEAEAAVEAKMLQALSMDQDQEERSRLLQVQDGVAVVEIKGKLTNQDRYYNRYFGLVSYSEVRTAMLQAQADPSVKRILLDMQGPGGTVDGLEDAADTLKAVSNDIPVEAFVGSSCMSAMYFLAAPTRNISLSKMAQAGSVGVVLSVVEYSKALKEDGVGVHIFRSGDLKAVGGHLEPLSKRSANYLSDQVATSAQLFFEHVSEHRKIPLPVLDSTGITDGGTYIGQEAVDCGLCDNLSTFDQVFAKLAAEAASQTTVGRGFSASGAKYAQGENMSDRTLMDTDTALAMAQVTAQAPETEETVQAKATVEAPEAEATVEAPEAEATVKAPEAEASEETSETPETPEADPVQALLQQQLAEANAKADDLNQQLALATSEKDALGTRLTAAENSAAQLQEIVVAALQGMCVAMNVGTPNMEGQSAEAVAAQYHTTKAEFIKKFQPGGVIPAADPKAEGKAEILPFERNTRQRLGF